MRISCDAEILNRGLASFGMRAKTKPLRSSLSIGRRPGASSSKDGLIYLMVCTAKDKNGTKYKVRVVLVTVIKEFKKRKLGLF